MAGKNQFEDPYERLANAIILSAVADYRATLKKVKRKIDMWNTSFESEGRGYLNLYSP